MKATEIFRFRLYVAGDAQNSTVAMANLTALCRRLLADCYEIEVVDVFRDPARALQDGVMMTPTLVRVDQLPMRRVVGNLSEVPWVIHALGLPAAVA
jgi:circadian clock protein KaiB